MTEIRNHRVSIDFHVDELPGDRISDSYYSSSPPSLLHRILDKVEGFYRTVGADYGLPGVEITFNLMPKEGVDESTRSPIHFPMVYTSLDNFVHDPAEALSELTGKPQHKFIESLKPHIMRNHECDPHEAREILRQFVIEEYEKSEGVWGTTLGAQKSVIHPNTDYQELPDDVVVNAYAYVIAHEIGHLFGLPHRSGKKSGPRNLMMEGIINQSAIDAFDVFLSRRQVQSISRYLDSTVGSRS